MANALYQLARLKMLNTIPNLFVTDATNATPIVITTDRNHGMTTGDILVIINVLGNTAANGIWTITYVSDTTFSLDTSVGNGAYTAGSGEVLLPDSLLRKLPYVIRWGVGSSGDYYGDDIKACLVNVSGAGTLYTVDLAQDEFLSDIPGASIISTSPNLTNKASQTGAGATTVGGVADADDFVFSAVGPAGTTIEALVVYKDTGTAATSPLIAYIDTGLAVTANGGDISVAIDSGANRLFKI